VNATSYSIPTAKVTLDPVAAAQPVGWLGTVPNEVNIAGQIVYGQLFVTVILLAWSVEIAKDEIKREMASILKRVDGIVSLRCREGKKGIVIARKKVGDFIGLA